MRAAFAGLAFTALAVGNDSVPAGVRRTDVQVTASAPAIDVRGAWRAERYLLKGGQEYPVRGQILFTDRNWTVLFFVVGPDGKIQRGSGEGGSYTIAGDRLVFTHFYLLSNEAPELPGLKAQPLRLWDLEPASRPTEPVTVELEGDRLWIHFGPSGNHMSFVRTAGE